VPAKSSGLTQSSKIGIGLGVPLAALLLAILAFFALRFYRHYKKRPRELRSEDAAELGQDSFEDGNVRADAQQRQEMTGLGSPRELITKHNTHEMSAAQELRELDTEGVLRRELP